MKVWVKRWMTFVLVICLVLPITGCWDYESISTRAALVGIGIDPVQNDTKKIRVTIQYPILSQNNAMNPTGGTSDNMQPMYKNLTIEAYTLSEALKHLQLRIDHEIGTAQLRAIIVSRKLPSRTMNNVIGELMRLPRMNHLAYVFTTPNTAKDVMSVSGTDSTPMDFLDRSMSFRQHGFVMRRQLWQYWRDTIQAGAVPVLPVVRVVPLDQGMDTVSLGGTTVYLNNQAKFNLNTKETFYIGLLSERVRDMEFSAPVDGGIVTLTGVRSNSRFRCVSQGSNLTLVDHVSIRGTLDRRMDQVLEPLQPADLNQIERDTAKYLTQQLTSALNLLQQHRADLVGFGRYYFQHHPDQEKRIEQHWEEMFQHAKVQVQVNVSISSRGMLI